MVRKIIFFFLLKYYIVFDFLDAKGKKAGAKEVSFSISKKKIIMNIFKDWW